MKRQAVHKERLRKIFKDDVGHLQERIHIMEKQQGRKKQRENQCVGELSKYIEKIDQDHRIINEVRRLNEVNIIFEEPAGEHGRRGEGKVKVQTYTRQRTPKGTAGISSPQQRTKPLTSLSGLLQ